MKLVSKICTAMMLCVVVACGNSNSNPPSDPSTGTNVPGDGNATNGNTTPGGGSLSVLTVSGTVANFAFDSNALTDDTNTLQVGVLDANNLYPNGTLQVASATPIKASDCTTTAGVRSCKFSIANVDTSKFTGGLLVVATDSRVSSATGDTSQWQTLATFVAPATLQAAQSKGSLASVAAYALSGSGRTALAALAGPSATGLTTTGAVIGLVTSNDGVTPVSGAAVSVNGSTANANTVVDGNAAVANPAPVATPAATKVGTDMPTGAGAVTASPSIYYANDTVTAGSTTGATSQNGLFLAVPASKTDSALANVTVTASAGTWTVPAVPAVSPLWMVVDLAQAK